MNLSEKRGIAISAVRSKARELGMFPERLHPDSALRILDDLARQEPELVASEWYLNASENQFKVFSREWREWAKQEIENNLRLQHEKKQLALKSLCRYLNDCGLRAEQDLFLKHLAFDYNGHEFRVYVSKLAG